MPQWLFAQGRIAIVAPRMPIMRGMDSGIAAMPAMEFAVTIPLSGPSKWILSLRVLDVVVSFEVWALVAGIVGCD